MPSDLIRICHTALAGHGGLFATLFVGGLVGSVTHCAGMCGPFVLSQTSALLDEKPLAGLSDLGRLRGAALLPYHAGRMTTYAFLGVAASVMTDSLRGLRWFDDLSAALLVLAGLVFLGSAFPRLAPKFLSYPVAFLPGFAGLFRYLFAQPRGWRGYILGIALGFLPCGLVYAAILSAAARGQPLTAALGMIVFAAATMPALIAVGVGGQYAFHKFRDGLRFVFPVLMIFNSLALFAMAGELIK